MDDSIDINAGLDRIAAALRNRLQPGTAFADLLLGLGKHPFIKDTKDRREAAQYRLSDRLDIQHPKKPKARGALADLAKLQGRPAKQILGEAKIAAMVGDAFPLRNQTNRAKMYGQSFYAPRWPEPEGKLYFKPFAEWSPADIDKFIHWLAYRTADALDADLIDQTTRDYGAAPRDGRDNAGVLDKRKGSLINPDVIAAAAAPGVRGTIEQSLLAAIGWMPSDPAELIAAHQLWHILYDSLSEHQAVAIDRTPAEAAGLLGTNENGIHQLHSVIRAKAKRLGINPPARKRKPSPR